jgi:predicted transposase/invertase (TIGR01784 family)
MADPAIQNPHDGFFKQTFGRVDFAQEFLAKFLPADVVGELDLPALQAISDSFVDDELRQTQSDLVFTVPLAESGEAIVYLLFEHKSYADRLTVFQLLKYVVRINERRVREGLPLCCVIPLVVYHGPSGWNVARRLDQLIDVPRALQRFLPQFSIELIDLSAYDDQELRGEAFMHASLLLLKYILREELPGELTKIIALLAAMSEQERALDCIKLLVNYVVQATDRVDAKTLQVAIRQGLENQGNKLMPTLAEQWASEGREQGLQEGLQRGLQKGRQEGTYIGAIQACRSILGEPDDSSGLTGKSVDELRELAEQLQARVRERLSGG